VVASHSIVALLQPYALPLICFQAVLLLLQQNRKYKVVHILAYLPRLDTTVIPYAKSDRVPGSSMDHFQVTI
jgi:hypothetical protein